MMVQNYDVNITLDNGTEVQVREVNEFVLQAKFEISCDLLAKNNTDEKGQGDWKLFENGTLLSQSDRAELQKKDYCLIPQKILRVYYELLPTSLQQEIQTKTNLDLVSGIKVVSVFCMAITIAVYLYLPQFHTIFSKCCLCYFISLTISFLLLWAESLYRDVKPNRIVCYMIGYCGYYIVMSVFMWLLVINYNLWKTFTNYGIMYKTSMQRYHIFVWSAAAVLLAITGSVEYMFLVMDYDKECSWQPGVSLYYCWINTSENWSAMIYYYGPILVVVLINVALSIMSARHIYVESKRNKIDLNSSEIQENLTNQAKFGMFFRLFAIAGVIWLLDILSYLLEINISGITFIFDIITSAQGILLFFLTIWKKDVLKSLYERMEAKGNKPSKQMLTSTTQA
ncbi:probable G-protein coupled receptor Mth-like 11 [Drosophila innubila]|uniref:probable G-protein coupled receptor Mth-like 11 n=1 Tax=Drosophila innubila TaxID=198719 RepID=UPI00148E1A3C|nr:probable G-protein coupled receptor Mth-like 11 [Drosophila innubila]